MKFKNIMMMLLLIVPVFAQDQKIPDLSVVDEDMLAQLEGTVWVSADLQRDKDLYVFFIDGKYGNSAVNRGAERTLPTKMYPIKFVQKGSLPHSGIFIVPSQEKILYYSFVLLTPYDLFISAGYNNMESLLKMEVVDYFTEGYPMKLIQ